MKLRIGGTLNAVIIGAPDSTAGPKARDPHLHQTRKDEQWYFGAKLHIGVDSLERRLVHGAVITAANEHDKHPLPQLWLRQEWRVYGDIVHARRR